MAVSIGKLSATATLSADGFQAGANKVMSEANRLKGQLKGKFDQIKQQAGMEGWLEGMFGRMGGAVRMGSGLTLGFESLGVASGIAFGKSLFQGITQSAGDAETFGALNDQLGTSIEFLSTFRTVAGESGIEATTFTSAMERLNQTIGSASQGSAEARAMFERLGVSWAEMVNGNADQNILRLASAFGAVENRAERARLSTELFGRGGGAAMLRVMNGGLAGAITDAGGRGGTTTAEQQEAMMRIDTAIDRMSTQWGNTWRSFVASTAPAVTTVLGEWERITTRVATGWRSLAAARISLDRTGADGLQPPEPFTPGPAMTNATSSPFVSSTGQQLNFPGFGGFPTTPASGSLTGQSASEIEAGLPAMRAAAQAAQEESERRRREANLARGAEENARADASGLGLSANSFARRAELAAASEAAVHADTLLAQARSRSEEATRNLTAADNALISARAVELARTDDLRIAANRPRFAGRTADMLREIDEGNQITQASSTPMEAYATRMERLNELHENGVISTETFARSTRVALESLTNVTPLEMFRRAVIDVQGASNLTAVQRGAIIDRAMQSLPQISPAPLLGSLSAGTAEVGAIFQQQNTAQVDELAAQTAHLEAIAAAQVIANERLERMGNAVDRFVTAAGG